MRSVFWKVIPSFASSFTVLCILWAGLIAWIFADASLNIAVAIFLNDIGLAEFESSWFDVHKWDAMGARVLVLFVLSIIACFYLVALVTHLFFGKASGRRVRSWLLVLIVINLWLAFFVSFGSLVHNSRLFRIRRSLPRFEAVAATLQKHWPVENGSLPEAGRFRAYPNSFTNTIELVLGRTKGTGLIDSFDDPIVW